MSVYCSSIEFMAPIWSSYLQWKRCVYVLHDCPLLRKEMSRCPVYGTLQDCWKYTAAIPSLALSSVLVVFCEISLHRGDRPVHAQRPDSWQLLVWCHAADLWMFNRPYPFSLGIQWQCPCGPFCACQCTVPQLGQWVLPEKSVRYFLGKSVRQKRQKRQKETSHWQLQHQIARNRTQAYPKN